MKQLSIDIPAAHRTEEIDLDKIIIVGGEMDETVCMNIFKSLGTLNIIFQPVMVAEEGTGFRLIFGHRRVLAARKAGHTKIPATIFPSGTPDEIFSMFVLTENMNRSANPAAEALAISNVMSAFKWKVADVSKHLGIPMAHIVSRVKLLELIPEFFQRLKEGKISFSLAKRLCKLPAWRQEELLQKEDLGIDEADDAIREEQLGSLPDELFQMPAPPEGEKSVDLHLTESIKQLEKAIAQSTNGRKGKMERALKLLKGVQTNE